MLNKNAALVVALVAIFSASPARAQDQISFNQKIRPILADICFNCHGPDAATNEGGVRLDSFSEAIKEGDSGNAVVIPGDSSASELVRRILDADDPMPPADFQKQLTQEQKELLAKWIDEGGKYEGHWAFDSPVRPKVPSVKDSSWPTNAIDHFVLAKLEENGLSPTDEASKETLIRRVALDLTGLPPSLEELEQFLADDSPAAYEEMVDRYLASTRYGERMAVRWLDYARYADSNGFQSDGSRDIWAWREWVINAYNRNLPFDQFTVEQLAGDMLPNPTRAQVVATGFNRNHRLNGEGGRIVDEWFVETVVDRVETTGMTWLGLTFNCCRCHDHKYDPISQKEFYSMFAFFNSNEESGVLAPAGKNGENTPPLLQLKTPEDEAKIATLKEQIKSAEKAYASLEGKEDELISAWVDEIKKELGKDEPASVWTTVDPKSITSKEGVKFEKQEDGSYLASGPSPANPIYTIQIPLTPGPFTGVMVETFADDRLPKKFLGRSPSNGNFVLTDMRFTISFDGKQEKPEAEAENGEKERKQVKFTRAEADFSQTNWPAKNVLVSTTKLTAKKAKEDKGWGTSGFDAKAGSPNRIMFVTERPVEVPENAIGTLRLYHRSVYPQHAIGRFRVNVTGVEPSKVSLGTRTIQKPIRNVIAIHPAQRNAKQKKLLQKFFREDPTSPFATLAANRDKKKFALKDFQDRLLTTMVMKEGKRRDAFVLERGEYDKPKEKVERVLPAFLPPMPEGQAMDRLGLANWIVNRSNPLTARVWVNRTWENLFGTGIVKSSENFGTQADFPSHPALLDWLAVEFMEASQLPAVGNESPKPWDMKAFIKIVLMSSTYRQDSRLTEERVSKDPTNRLLSRGPRFRLSGEVIRDQALAASGLLVEQIGGPSVRPYMPEGVWDETSVYGNLRNYKADTGDGLYRRTLYTIWKRTAAPPSMLLFDAPNRETCTVTRSKTNTPLQALSLLNEITFVEAAQAFAERMVAEGGDTPESRVEFAFKVLTSRKPTEFELSTLVEGLREDIKNFKASPGDAKAFLKSVNAKYAESLSEEELPIQAAYALTANILLNLDEVVTRE